MSPITTHVLDTARGRPAAGVEVTLERGSGDDWSPVGGGRTDEGGRLGDLGSVAEPGRYRLRFDSGGYFAADGTPAFFPEVVVQFTVERPEEHHHVPLLLSPFGYSTYRGG
ncbi:MAG TPA: hydroxyisourate hydrolase [Thermoleophilaceae bacterium]